jgi:hypothetical protein
MTNTPHSFHIPVMGTGFTIDTPLRVAKYGISSVVSLVDDILIEQVRKFYCEKHGLPYEEITSRDPDARAQRITAYLNLVERLVRQQVEGLRGSAFEKGSEITRYYEMLPETPLKRAYEEMLASFDPDEKRRRQEMLRREAVPGSIDVNIMTKVDRDAYLDGKKLPPEFADAMAALRGYANSTLCSSVVFSAGINQRLYNYTATFGDFLPGEDGELKKKIVLKVSDYRSALVQGKFLAKRGLWVSEYRIESGLNCGGHAFPTEGHLLGPVLEEFKEKRRELIKLLHPIYVDALKTRGWPVQDVDYGARITVQGGIGTAVENSFLLTYYHLDGTGWATPFLLVPEVTNVDAAHLQKLLSAVDGEVYLSDSSPLGIPFWNLRTSASEESRRQKILLDKPGSPCPKGFAAFNTEFTETPACIASRVYVKRKLEHLADEDFSDEQFAAAKKSVLDKACICHDLAGGTTLKYNINPEATPAVCAGPNIVNFNKLATLEEMVAHIYGRLSLITNSERPHMFIKELMLYMDYLRNEAKRVSLKVSPRSRGYFDNFRGNLMAGIDYYHRLACEFIEEQRVRFLEDLETLRDQVEHLPLLDHV